MNLVLALVLFPSCWLQKQITHYDSVQTQNHKKATVKDSYHLPHILNTLDMLCGNNLFTTLDLLKEYHQIEVEESSRKKTAFYYSFRTLLLYLFTLLTDQYSCLLSTSLGTRPLRLHWQVCYPIH